MKYLSKDTGTPSRNPKTETPQHKTGVLSTRCWLRLVYIYCIWVNIRVLCTQNGTNHQLQSQILHLHEKSKGGEKHF